MADRDHGGDDWERRALELELRCRDLERRGLELTQMATHDALTGALNRRGLDDALHLESERARRSSTRLAALLVDCDDFKQVNDAFGHAIGDRVLCEVSDVIRRTVRPTDYVCRVGGDEFLVLLTDVRAEDAFLVAERIRGTVRRLQVPTADGAVDVTCSIGWAWLNDEQLSIEAILRLAGAGLARSKAMGKDAVSKRESGIPLATLPPDLPPSTRTTLPPPHVADPNALELCEVLAALRKGTGLTVVGQPIVSLRSGETFAYELCTRGTNAGYESPESFIHLSMENHAAVEVDLACLERSAQQWEKRYPTRHVNLNVLPSTLLTLGAHPILEVTWALARSTQGNVCFELSERRITGSPAALRPAVEAVRRAGLRVALDEVGFSRSALEALTVLSPDLAKIDRRLVTGCGADPARQRTLQRLADVLASMAIPGVAVGVESEEDLAIVRAAGFAFGQGYYFAPPTRLAELAS